MNSVELYFDDLTPAAQARVLAANNISSPEEANWDTFPLTILEFEPEGA